MKSTISLQNKTLDTKLKTILSLSLCHDILAKHTCSCTTLFHSTPNLSIFELCSYRPSCWAHGRSMPPRSDQVVLACVNKRKRKKENSRAVRLEHATASVSASTESPPSMLQLLLPQHPCNVTTLFSYIYKHVHMKLPTTPKDAPKKGKICLVYARICLQSIIIKNKIPRCHLKH